MFNINQAMQLVNVMKNPQEMLKKMGIPQENLDTPQNALKYLMDNGRVTQDQVEQMKNLYQQFYQR